MNDLIEVLSRIESTASGKGNSFYTKLCPKQAKLDMEVARPAAFDMSVGSVMHKLLELYYTNQLSNVVLPLNDSADFKADPVQEGLRLLTGYMRIFPTDEWQVIATERRLPRTLEDGTVHPGDLAIMHETFGVEYAVRPDAKVYVNEEQAAKLEENQRIHIIPGFYLVDYKTHSQKANNAATRYALSTQFKTYIMAENAIFPDQEVQGMLVRDIVRHSDLTKLEKDGLPRSFSTYFVPAPSEGQQEMIKNYLQWKAQWIEEGRAEIGACVDYISGRVCSHFEEGRCQRV